jgi:hypothetical protein
MLELSPPLPLLLLLRVGGLSRLNARAVHGEASSTLRVCWRVNTFTITVFFALQMTSTRKRIYQEKFLSYGFSQIEDKGIMKPECGLKVLTAESFKKSQLKKHLDNLYPHLSSKPRENFGNLEMLVKRQRLDCNLRRYIRSTFSIKG